MSTISSVVFNHAWLQTKYDKLLCLFSRYFDRQSTLLCCVTTPKLVAFPMQSGALPETSTLSVIALPTVAKLISRTIFLASPLLIKKNKYDLHDIRLTFHMFSCAQQDRVDKFHILAPTLNNRYLCTFSSDQTKLVVRMPIDITDIRDISRNESVTRHITQTSVRSK